MVTIPDFLSGQQSSATRQAGIQDPNQVASAQTRITAQTQRLLQSQLVEADQRSAEAKRAEIANIEAQHNARMSTALPMLFQQIGGQLTKTALDLQALDDKQAELELKAKEDYYIVNQSIAFQERYFNYVNEAQQKAGPDGAGYTANTVDWVNKEIEAILQQAPSEASRLDMFKSMGQFKLKALTAANSFERNRRTEARQFSLLQGANSLANQAFANPAEAGEYIDQLNGYRSILEQDTDMSPIEIEKALQRASSPIFSSAIKGMLSQGNYTEAQKMLHSDAAMDTLDNNQFIALQNGVDSIRMEQIRIQQEELHKANIIAGMKMGLAPENVKEANEAANAIFDEEINSLIGPDGKLLEGYDMNDLQAVAVDTYRKYPAMPIGSKHKNIMTNGIMNGDPVAAVENANIVKSLLADPISAHKVAALPEQARTEAIKIMQLVDFGIPPAEAVETARKELRTVDPNRLFQAKLQVDEYFQDNGPIDLVDEVMGVDSGVGAMDAAYEAEQVLRSLTARHGDIEVALEQVKMHMGKKYAVSSFNGSSELMPYAPEKYYNAQDLNIMHNTFNQYLKDVTKELGGDVDLAGSHGLIGHGGWRMSFKDQLGDPREINVKLKDAGVYTAQGSNKSRQYLIVDTETNIPILESQVKPGGMDRPLSFNFKLEDTPEYKEKMKEKEENAAKLREWRLTKIQENGIMKQEVERQIEARKLKPSEKEGILSKLSEIARYLGAQ